MGNHGFDARIQRADGQGDSASLAGAGDGNRIPVYVVPGYQIVDAANDIRIGALRVMQAPAIASQ
jgi:hypothetical protein